ncbi:helix-turn-helix transcriptional regulator [Alteromonas lipotrueae]|jgi:predicted DNA-binding transcriptional regulator AlpA|uniref:helix-turn-helix transcriptional regulator n=1 Tax=Alteromonas lipotrueae TaxID=2803814 RepID=UPI001C43D39B|nr:DNA-binding protein [Alteromonas lipotrueae]
MNNEIKSRALSEKEASSYICMSRSFLRQARMDGNRENRTPAPPFIKIGRAVRYLREDLDAWLESFVRRTHLYQDERAA